MKRRAAWIVAVAVVATVIVAAVVLLWPRGADEAGGRAAGRTLAADELSDADQTALAQQQLDAHLVECTVPAVEAPSGCGIHVPWQADFAAVDGIHYRIEQTPTVTLTPPTFRADGGVLIATVTGSGLNGAARSMTYRTENWMLRGDATVKRRGVVLEPW